MPNAHDATAHQLAISSENTFVGNFLTFNPCNSKIALLSAYFSLRITESDPAERWLFHIQLIAMTATQSKTAGTSESIAKTRRRCRFKMGFPRLAPTTYFRLWKILSAYALQQATKCSVSWHQSTAHPSGFARMSSRHQKHFQARGVIDSRAKHCRSTMERTLNS